MKKEIIKNDKKWIFEKEENGTYTIYYYEYHKSCNAWVNVSKNKNNSLEIVEMVQHEQLTA